MSKFYKSRCWYCGERLSPRTWTRDHVQPIALGGSWHVSNLVEACASCNNLKADLPLEDFRQVFFGAHVGKFYGERTQQEVLA